MSNPPSGSTSAGRQIGPYRITSTLGEGGAGQVYYAEHVETGKPYALKTLRPDATEIEEIHARFIREISVAQKLNDPNIVTYEDCGVDDGVLYYAMEHVPWGSLATILQQRGTLPWREACECGAQISLALEHLHEAGIVHRDLKPANVFLSDDGRLKLGDFGLARDSESTSLTVSGMTVGTAKYISPEQAIGSSKQDDRADLYALGCNLYQFIVGRTPFEDPDAYAQVPWGEMIRRHVEAPVPRLADFAPHCPVELSELVSQLLAKDPAKRPSSAAEVRNRLLKILEKNPAGDASNPPSESNGEDGQHGNAEEEPHLTERLRSSVVEHREVSNRKLVILGMVVAAVIFFAAVILPRV